MKLTIPTPELRDAVTGLSRVMARKNALPILRGICFESGGRVTARATDLEASACYAFEGAQSEGSGAFVLDLDDARTLSRSAKTGEIVLQGSETRISAEITGSGRVMTRHLAGMDPEEYPPAEKPVSTEPAPGFLASYRNLAAFASTDETRAILCGICVDASQSGEQAGCMVATDGRRLTCRNSLSLPVDGTHVLPVSRFLQWTGLPGDERLGIRKSKDGLCTVQTGHWTFSTRLIDGTYPNWRQVLPGESANQTMAFSEPDIELLLGTLASLTGCEAVTFIGDGSRISAWARRPEDPGWTSFELPGASGTAAHITCSRPYVIDAIRAGFFRSISFENDLSPLVSRDGKGGTHVLMPMRAELPEHIAGVQAASEPVRDQEPAADTNTHQEKTMPKTTEQEALTPLERALGAVEETKGRLREIQAAIHAVATEVKAAIRDQKTQGKEMETARAALAKLQAISL